MQPKQFKVLPSAIGQLVRKRMFFFAPILIVAIATGLLIAHYGDGKPDKDLSYLLFAIPFPIAMVLYSVYSNSRKQKAQLSSYTLTFYENSIERQQHDLPIVRLYHSEIKSIYTMQYGSICIHAFNSADSIVVPPAIEQYEEVKEILQTIKPFDKKSINSVLSKYTLVIAIATLGLMVLVFTSVNAVLVTLGGVSLIVMFVWSLIVGSKSKSIDRKTKRGLWWIVILAFAIVARVVNAWLN